MISSTTIRLTGVSKAFGETQALAGCDFDAVAGEVHAIVGENGSGKSTLAKIMSGVLSPDAGSVDVLGGAVHSPREGRQRGVTTIFQEILVADDASVYDNLYAGADGLLFSRGAKSDRRAKAAALMRRFVGRPVELDAIVGGLPLNIKQWIVIARSVLQDPKVIILDESSAALDLDATKRLYEELGNLKQRGITILLVTHRIAELVQFADRATVLRDGKNAGVLSKEQITEERLIELMTPAHRMVTAASDACEARTLGKPVIEARSLQLAPSLKPFDFSLPAGSIIGLTGLDGAGQDHFARILAGINRPFSGELFAMTTVPAPMYGLAAASREGIAWVSGDRKREGIFPQQSILENLAIGVYGRRLGPFGLIDKRSARQAFEREVDRFKIKLGAPWNRITSLSGGNQQKVLIGRAFANHPKVIVLNDPARGVDIGTKRDLYRELSSFASAGGTVVYLSTEIEEFLGFADRVDVFRDGTLFRSIDSGELSEDSILAAMFGQPVGQSISLKTSETSGA